MPRTGPSLAITSSARRDMSQDWGSLNGKVRQWRAQGNHWDELIPAMRGKAQVRTQWDQVLEWEQRRELAVVDERAIFPGGSKAVRITNKALYRELGIENVRHRREADDSLLLRRLLSLDYILEHPELPWLPTEQEKVAFFDALGIDRRRIPRRVYQGAVGFRSSV